MAARIFREREPLELVDESGRVVAREGDMLEVDATDFLGPVPYCQVGPRVLIVGEIVAVNGIRVEATSRPAPTLEPNPPH